MRAWRAGNTHRAQSGGVGFRNAGCDDCSSLCGRRLRICTTGGEWAVRDGAVGGGRSESAVRGTAAGNHDRRSNMRADGYAITASCSADPGPCDMRKNT